MRDRLGLCSLALYLALAIAFFGRSLPGNLGGLQLGRSVDSSFLMWSLVWWPYALIHGLNPFLCHIVWAPKGFNLAWTGSIPLASVITAPFTSWLGPVRAYNLLCLLAPGLAAWCTFLLCRYVTKLWWAAALGGYIFGFSPYILGQLFSGHLNLLFVFPAPLAVLTILVALEGRIRKVTIIALIAGEFIIQFLLSIELAATAVFFGVIGLAIAWIFFDREMRTRIAGLLLPLTAAAIISLLVLAPYFYYLLAFGIPHGTINSPLAYSADLLNLFIPNRTIQSSTIVSFQALSSWAPAESGAFVGVPLLALIVMYGRARRQEPAARVLIVSFGIICLLALGPRLRIAGATFFGMPWKIFMHVPVLKNALPGRFMNYAVLVAGVITAIWISDRTLPWTLRLFAVVLIVPLGMPNLNAAFWTARVDVPAFFASRAYRHYLRPGQTIIAIPYGVSGNTMLWQAEAGLYFTMAGGYTGIIPREFERWPVVRAFSTATLIPDSRAQLRAFMAAHQSSVIVADDQRPTPWTNVFLKLDPSRVRIAGVTLYRVPSRELIPYRKFTSAEMERRNCAARFDALLSAARDYLRVGGDPSRLTPMRAQQLNLLPGNWVNRSEVRTNNGLYLGPWNHGKIAIGVVASYDAGRPLIDRYRADASEVLFPFPKTFADPPRGDTFMRLLVLVFDRAAVLRAVAKAGYPPD